MLTHYDEANYYLLHYGALQGASMYFLNYPARFYCSQCISKQGQYMQIEKMSSKFKHGDKAYVVFHNQNCLKFELVQLPKPKELKSFYLLYLAYSSWW